MKKWLFYSTAIGFLALGISFFILSFKETKWWWFAIASLGYNIAFIAYLIDRKRLLKL